MFRFILVALCSLTLAANAFGDAFVVTSWDTASFVVPNTPKPLAIEEAAHTPMAEVVRVIKLLPKPQTAFVDLGCGYDARWCVAAAEHWGCKCIGIEIDHERAVAARQRVQNLGLSHLIEIVEGDAGTVSVNADVAVCYLYPELLKRLKPRLEWFRALASYQHRPGDLPATKNGDTWLYYKPTVAVATPQVSYQQTQGVAVWEGVQYSGRVCTSPNCRMCNSIQQQIYSR